MGANACDTPSESVLSPEIANPAHGMGSSSGACMRAGILRTAYAVNPSS